MKKMNYERTNRQIDPNLQDPDARGEYNKVINF